MDTSPEKKSLENDAEDICLNCGAILHGKYCHICGQRKESLVLPVHHAIGIMLREFFSIDQRFFLSIRKLLFSPGFLSREYLSGRRVRYSSPLRMFLIISAAYFAVLHITGSTTFFSALQVEPNLVEGLRTWLPRVVFLSIPVFAALLRLLHIRHGRFYLEYLVFSLHYFSFLFTIIILQAIFRSATGVDIPRIGESPYWIVSIDSLLQLTSIVYLIVALKKVFPQKLSTTLLKALLIILSELLFLVLCGVGADAIW